MTDIRHVAGLDQLGKALHAIPAALAKKHMGQAVAAGSRLVRDQAEAWAPVDTGRLQQAVLMKRSSATPLLVRYIIGVRHGPRAQHARLGGGLVNLDAYYWFMVEFGTSKMRAEPFLRPAWEAKKDEALTTLTNHLRVSLTAEAIAHSWGRPTALSTSGYTLRGSVAGNFVGPRAPA